MQKINLTAIHHWTIQAGMKSPGIRMFTLDRTAQTSAHAARHGGFHGNLAGNVQRFGDTGHTGQHAGRTASQNDVRSPFSGAKLHGMGDEALIAQAAVVRSDGNRQIQSGEISFA